MARIADTEKGEIPTLSKVLAAQSNDSFCRTAFLSVRSPNTQFSVDSYGVLLLAPFLGGASQ